MKKLRNKILKLNNFILFFMIITILFGLTTFAKYVMTNYVFGVQVVGQVFDGTNLIDSDINLERSTDILINPYRGYYQYGRITIPAYDNDDAALNETNRQGLILEIEDTISEMGEGKNSISLQMIYLNNYREVEKLPSFYLDVLDELMDIYRQNGYKTIIRFAYGENYGEALDSNANEPSDFNMILSHFEQLTNFFQTNKDVIHSVQLGFIGPWGEMHSSEFATTEYINQLIDKALEVVPYPIQIGVRRPSYYRNYFNDTSYFERKLAFTSESKARIGIFNDAFLSSDTDKGTYGDGLREDELEWQSYLSPYVMFGAEMSYDETTYPPTEEHYFEVVDAKYNMEKTHLNYLHDGYAVAVLDYWKTVTITEEIDPDYVGIDAYTYFANKFGYRFLVTEAKVPGYEINQGGILNFSVSILNEGFGNLIYQRGVEVILEKDGQYYKAVTDKNPSLWFSGTTEVEEFVFKLPSNMEPGIWNIYLSLPDAYESCRDNVNTAIKFANKDGWYSAIQGNYIGKISIVDGSDNSNNGFYQLNDVNETVEDNASLNTVERLLTIDGEVTDQYEWYQDDLVYDDGITSLSMYEDDEYIYLLGNTNDYNNTHHIQISFLLDTSSTNLDYKYMIEDSRLYEGSYASGNIIESSGVAVEENWNSYWEYKIPKAYLNISSVDQITGLRIDMLDSAWNELYTVLINEFKLFYTTVVDGQNTNNEWNDNNLVYSDSDVTIWAQEEAGYLFLYAETTTPIIDQNKVRLYFAGASSTNAVDYNRIVSEKSVYSFDETGNYGVDTLIAHATEVIQLGYEYKIDLTDIDAESLDDFKSIKFSFGYEDETGEDIAIFEKKFSFDVSDLSIIIDGIKKDGEWDEQYKFYENNKSLVYVASDSNYLYIYGLLKNYSFADFEDLEVYIATKQESTSSTNYVRLLDNEYIYDGVSTSNTDYHEVFNHATDVGFEYQIVLSDLRIQSYEDIIGLLIRYGNTDSTVEEIINPLVIANISIDGLFSDGEYAEQSKFYEDSQSIVYMVSDANYLYLYGELKNYLSADYENLQVHFATSNASDSVIDYVYQTENSRLYVGSYNNGGIDETIDEKDVYDYASSTGFEYQISLADLGITSSTEIIGLCIEYINAEWETIASVPIDLEKELDIIIDGLKGDSEYSDDDKFYENNNSEVYMVSDSKYLYLYGLLKNYSLADYDTLNVLFATSKESSSPTDYAYLVEDGELYVGTSSSGVSKLVMNYGTDVGFEYQISLADLGVTSANDIIGLKIRYENSDSTVIVEEVVNPMVTTNIVIDGVMSEGEWLDTHQYFDNNYASVYMTNDTNYLYLYGLLKNYSLQDYPHLQVHISTESASTGPKDYAYQTEDDNLYVGSYNNGGVDETIDSKDVYAYAYDLGFEYQIALADLGITSYTEIIGLCFEYITAEWSSAASYEMDPNLQNAIIIDGANTDSEWDDEKLLADSNNIKLYGTIIGENLYLYGETAISFSNLALELSLDETSQIVSYDSKIENSSYYLYEATLDDWTKIESVTNKRTSNSYEYCVPLSTLGIETIEEILAINFVLMDENWDTTYEEVIIGLSDPVYIDGDITNPNEWNESHIVGSSSTSNLYYKNVGDHMLYYISYNGDISIIANYNITLYQGDTRIAKIENGRLYLRDNVNSTWISIGKDAHAIATGIEAHNYFSSLGLTSISDITSLKVTFMDSSWAEIESYTAELSN